MAAAEDAARFRDALGAAIPRGLPGAFVEPVADPHRRSRRAVRAHPRAVPRRRRRAPASASPSTRCGARSTDSKPSAASSPASSAPTGSSASGATSRCCAGSGGDRSLACGARSSRSTPRRSPASCPRGRASARGGAAPTRCSTSSASCRGRPIPASVLEIDVLATRVQDYHPGLLDELCASGEVVWIGAGGIGAHDGRIALCFRDEARLLAPPTGRAARRTAGRRAARASRAARARRSGPSWCAPRAPPTSARCSPRCGTSCGRARSPTTGSRALRAMLGARPRAAPKGRPRPGRLTRVGPPAGAGRWSLVAPMLEPAPSPTEVIGGARAAAARPPRHRHPRSRARRGHPRWIRRGVPGAARRSKKPAERGAATSSPGSVPRSSRCPVRPSGVRASTARPRPRGSLVLAATDPAQPYGAALPWPELPDVDAGDDRRARCPDRRAAPARSWCSATARRSRSSTRAATTCSRSTSTTSTGSASLPDVVRAGRVRRLEIQRVNGVTVRSTPVAAALEHAGFVPTPRGVVLRS